MSNTITTGTSIQTGKTSLLSFSLSFFFSKAVGCEHVADNACRRSQPRVIEYYEEPRASRRSVSRSRRVSDVRRSEVEVREPRRSSGYVDEREIRREVSRSRY